MKFDIHNCKRRLMRAEKRLQTSKISKKDKDMIYEFETQLFADGLGLLRIEKYLLMLQTLGHRSTRPICTASRKEIISILAWLERSDYTDWTKRDYRIILKRYLEFCKRDDLCKLIQVRGAHCKKLPEELLTTEDIQELLDTSNCLQDKAVISSLWESGCRIGELLGIQRKHVKMDSLGAILIVEGKTGMRRIRLLESAAILDEWISEKSPGQDQRIFSMNYPTCAKRLKVLARRAGIGKRIYPHLFRHSRATFLAGYLTEAQLCAFMGWTVGSSMARIYVHLNGADLDGALMNIPTMLSFEKIRKKETINQL